MTYEIGATKANIFIVKSEENWFIAGNIGLSVRLVLFLSSLGSKMRDPGNEVALQQQLSSVAKVTIVEKFIILYCEKTSFLLWSDY